MYIDIHMCIYTRKCIYKYIYIYIYMYIRQHIVTLHSTGKYTLAVHFVGVYQTLLTQRPTKKYLDRPIQKYSYINTYTCACHM